MASYIFHSRFYDIQTFALKVPCKKGQIQTVRRLLQNGERVNYLSMRGTSPLGVAVHYNQLGVAHLLLDFGADPTIGVEDSCPLDLAIENNNLAMIQLLLEFGCPITEENIDVARDLDRREIIAFLQANCRMLYNPIPLIQQSECIVLPEGFLEPFTLEEINPGNVVVRLHGNNHFIYDRESLECFWDNQILQRLPLLNPKDPGSPITSVKQVELLQVSGKN